MSYLLLAVAALMAEIASLVLAGSYLGALPTFGLLAVSFVIGVVVLSGRGAATVRDVVVSLQTGRSPGKAIVDGALKAIAGILFITPGFASDLVAIALLLPPVRAGIRARMKAWVRVRWQGAPGSWTDGGGDDDGADDGRGRIEVIDATGHETPDRRPPRGPSLPS
ncbi:MAG TPA: FxsA family protein [Kofleriaceae bacterium]|nr:FxsA family protein [Kofleriaceae bacterium]